MKHQAYIYNLGQAFSRVAQKHPGKTAINYVDKPGITYSDLDILSSQIASWLKQQQFGPRDVACILHDKSIMAYALMLGCLKAGVTYSNTDTTSPAERISRILSTACPQIIFFADNHKDKIPQNYKTQCYTDPAFVSEIRSCTVFQDFQQIPATTPAYLMFTSGSTGYPKGAVMSHQNVLNFVAWSKTEIKPEPDEVFTNINPMHFDNSVFDFYVSLFNGATLTPISEALTKNPRHMVKYIEQAGCTIWFSVPSMLVYTLRMRALEKGDMPDLRKIIFGGEGFPGQHLRTLYHLMGAQAELINVYGPTECTCICSKYIVQEPDIDSDRLLPLGPMAPNFDYLLVDEDLRSVEQGTTGELLIGGPCVGLGYYNNPEKTASAFIQNPNHTFYQDMFYRSGDLVWYDQDYNTLHFAGRKDYQVKRMGYRIELEEIESALHAVPGVEEAACVFTGKDIFACICASIDEQAIAARLQELLPSYMMPRQFKKYQTLPRNQNGKIDRVALKQELCS